MHKGKQQVLCKMNPFPNKRVYITSTPNSSGSLMFLFADCNDLDPGRKAMEDKGLNG